MKILLDNCVHYKAKRIFAAHDVVHCRDVGWREFKNGELLAAAALTFDVLVTTDKKIRFEQNLERLPVSVLELNTLFTRIQDLQSLDPFVESALAATKFFRFVSVGPFGVLETLAPVDRPK